MANSNSAKPLGVHLVGSVPMDNSSAVFHLCCEHLSGHLQRLPDGETGERSNWIAWQREIFAATSQLQAATDDPSAPFQLKDGLLPDQVEFPELGYARAALDSYAQFKQLKLAGAIPSHMRFQVSLPTPLAPVQFYIAPDHRAQLEPVYEAALLAELSNILQGIPARELAIQWDTAVEFGILEGVFPAFFADPLTAIVERLVRLGQSVPADVELGYHLCYGDSGHKHFVEPADTGWLTQVANAVCAGLSRSLNWLHLPVPKERFDVEYFLPLKSLVLPATTQLYLGLVHASDGESGAGRRIAAASEVAKQFGVATECGFGRRPQASLPGLLALHAQVCE